MNFKYSTITRTLTVFGAKMTHIFSNVSVGEADFLFLKYRSMTVSLMEIAKDYYPHIGKAELLRRANSQKLPFSVFKMDPSSVHHFWCTLKILLMQLIKSEK